MELNIVLLHLRNPAALERVRANDDELLDLAAHAQRPELGQDGQRLTEAHLHEVGIATPTVGAGDGFELDGGEVSHCRSLMTLMSSRTTSAADFSPRYSSPITSP